MILIEKRDGLYRAEEINLNTSSLFGEGRSPVLAVTDLFDKLAYLRRDVAAKLEEYDRRMATACRCLEDTNQNLNKAMFEGNMVATQWEWQDSHKPGSSLSAE